MNKIISFKSICPISFTTARRYSVGELLPNAVSWVCNGCVYNRKQENGGLCAVLLECDNVIGVVESPYVGSFNPAYVLDETNQIIWNVSDLFLAIYGKMYYGGKLHFSDVRTENGTLWFFVYISGCDFRFSFDVQTGEIGQLIETR